MKTFARCCDRVLPLANDRSHARGSGQQGKAENPALRLLVFRPSIMPRCEGALPLPPRCASDNMQRMRSEIAQAIQEVDALIALLGHELPAKEVDRGWNPAMREKWQEVLRRVRSELANDQLDPRGANLGYGLGTHGIDHGEVADRIAQLGSRLMALAAQHPPRRGA